MLHIIIHVEMQKITSPTLDKGAKSVRQKEFESPLVT